jgi:GTP cyclohydrolase IA
MTDLESGFSTLLSELGDDGTRPGLIKTPLRAAKLYRMLTEGYKKTLQDVTAGAVFSEKNNDLILLKGMPFYSLCEHHFMPFFGVAHVAFIPDGNVMGLSKVADVVHLFARRLQVQERLTDQVADALQQTLKPIGLGVVLEARHLCMELSGEQARPASVITSCVRGTFRSRPETRAEFFSLLR